MAHIKAEDLVVGEIYITRGGTVILEADESKTPVPWGYDRVRFIKLTDTHIIVGTPWGTECELPLDYPLFSTSETVMRSEFPLRPKYQSRTIIPFDEALKIGITLEVSADTLRKEKEKKKQGSTPIVTGANSPKRDDFIPKLIKYFTEYHTYAEAANHLGVKYQKIRYTLNNIKKKGHGIHRFTFEVTKDKVAKTKLVKVTK